MIHANDVIKSSYEMYYDMEASIFLFLIDITILKRCQNLQYIGMNRKESISYPTKNSVGPFLIKRLCYPIFVSI